MNFYKNKLFVIFSFAFLIFLSYQPILVGDYLFTDTYNLSFPKIGANNSDDFFIGSYEKLSNIFIGTYGRPLTFYYFIFLNKIILDPGDAFYFRLIAILMIIFIYFSMTEIFNNLNIPFHHSVALAAIIVTTPSFLIHSYWLVMIPGLASVLFAIYAYKILEGVEFNKKKELSRIFLSSLFIMLSLFIYQQNSTFFLLLLLLPPTNSFLNKSTINLKFFFLKIIVFIISLLFHLLILKFYYEAKLRGPELHPIGIYYKVKWFISEVIPLAMNFFFFNFNIIFLFFLVFLILIYSIKKFKDKKSILEYAFFLGIVIFFASALLFFPVLIAKGYITTSHRVILTLSSFFIIIIYFLIKNFFKKRKILTYFLFLFFLQSYLKIFLY